MITICLFCKRRKICNGVWVDDDDPDRTDLVSHVTCPDCKAAGRWMELMKYKAIGGSWDGLMIGFEGERTEKRFRTRTKRKRPATIADVDSNPFSLSVHAETYILRSILQVRPINRRDGAGIINEPVGEVIFYLNSSLRNLNDTEILQLLIDQHRPQPDNGENNE